MSDVEKLFPDDEMDAETERLVYRITEGLQRLNSIGTVQYIQINLPPLPENIRDGRRFQHNPNSAGRL